MNGTGFYFSSGGVSRNRFQAIIAGQVDTADATVTTILTIPIRANEAALIYVRCIAMQQTTGVERGAYIRQALVVRPAAAGAEIEGFQDEPLTRETTAGMDVNISVSGNNALVRVTGIAATDLDWRAEATIVRRVAA